MSIETHMNVYAYMWTYYVIHFLNMEESLTLQNTLLPFIEMMK